MDNMGGGDDDGEVVRGAWGKVLEEEGWWWVVGEMGTLLVVLGLAWCRLGRLYWWWWGQYRLARSRGGCGRTG